MNCGIKNLVMGLIALLASTHTNAAPLEVKADYKFESDAKTGLVLFATWMPDMTGFVTENTLVKIFFRDATKSRYTGKMIPFYRKMLFKAEVQSDYEDGYGLLRAIELPPGDYVFSEWHFFNGSGVTFYPKDLGELPFKVAAGRVTYVGSFDLDVQRGKNVFGVEVALNPWLLISDRRDRDLLLLQRKFPGIPADLVDIQIPDPTPWQAGGTYPEMKQVVPGP